MCQRHKECDTLLTGAGVHFNNNLSDGVQGFGSAKLERGPAPARMKRKERACGLKVEHQKKDRGKNELTCMRTWFMIST
jgi:hypothetical protein